MPRPVAVVELGMEAQTAIRSLRKSTAPLYEAALASGDYPVIQETHALAESLRIAGLQARRLTGFAQALCPDGRKGAAHGRAA